MPVMLADDWSLEDEREAPPRFPLLTPERLGLRSPGVDDDRFDDADADFTAGDGR